MANLSITRRCQRGCHFCFARDELARVAPADMSQETYTAALDFLERSGLPEARLLGGEPTQHPLFGAFVAQALGRGLRVVVFSGGLVPRAALDCMAGVPPGQLTVVLNTADPETEEPGLIRRQRELCARLGPRVLPGVTVFSSAQQLQHPFDLIAEFGLRRALRVGLAQPAGGGGNTSFPLRRPASIPIFEALTLAAERAGVELLFDCGFTPCMFTPGFVEAHASLFAPPAAAPGTELVQALGVRCNPVVDILPEGDCIACYALSDLTRLPLPASGTCDALISAFSQTLDQRVPALLFPGCADCSYRLGGLCVGGCRARRSLRLRPIASRDTTTKAPR